MDNTSEREQESEKKGREKKKERNKERRKQKKKHNKQKRGSTTVHSSSACIRLPDTNLKDPGISPLHVLHKGFSSKTTNCHHICTSPSGIMQGRMPSSRSLVHLRLCSRQRPHHAIAPWSLHDQLRDMEWWRLASMRTVTWHEHAGCLMTFGPPNT